jgi:hypothetical protein
MKKSVKRALQATWIALCASALTGCINYRSTGSVPGPMRPIQLTGSHVPTPATSAKAAAASSTTAVTVYDRSDLDRSGSTDLAGFLQRAPAAQIQP